MEYAYTIRDQFGVYFVTFTVHQWVDVFTRQSYVNILLDNIAFCQENKGLKVYGWVPIAIGMSYYCHLIISSDLVPLSDIIRDLKKYTSKKLLEAINSNEKESRKRWLLWLLTKDRHGWFWEEGYHGEEIYSKEFF